MTVHQSPLMTNQDPIFSSTINMLPDMNRQVSAFSMQHGKPIVSQHPADTEVAPTGTPMESMPPPVLEPLIQLDLDIDEPLSSLTVTTDDEDAASVASSFFEGFPDVNAPTPLATSSPQPQLHEADDPPSIGGALLAVIPPDPQI